MSAQARKTKPSIVIVDDEPMLLELATVILEPMGYEVQAFRDPHAAVDAFGKCDPKPRLVISDYSMQSMSGADLMKEIRKIEPLAKVLIVSGTVAEDLFAGSTSKPDGFLSKPYQAKELIDKVRHLVES
jgi:CheY-like chemotaxis protein